MTRATEGDTAATAALFTDILLAVVAGLILIVFLLISHLNPPGADGEGDTVQDERLRVYLTWPDELRTDVDLWVQGPLDRPVGYSRKTGLVFSLFRDDLGHALDLGGRNFEDASTRGLPPGEYIINVHLFSNRSGRLPIPVTVEVYLKSDPNLSAKRIMLRTAELLFPGQEITVVRFTIDDAGNVVPESVHARFKPLRQMGRGL